MNHRNLTALAMAFACLATVPLGLEAQGKGKGAEKDKSAKVEGHGSHESDKAIKKVKADRSDNNKGEKSPRAKSNASDFKAGARGVERRSDRANEVAAGPRIGVARSRFLSAKEVKRYNRNLRDNQVHMALRPVFASNRNSDLIAGGALAYALARGISPSDLLFARNGDFAEVKNKKGNILLSLRDDDARSLGAWRVAPLTDETAEGAPSFCRSGEGHPVWGRQWCIDKGFGLSGTGRTRWGRTGDVSGMRWNGDLGTGSLTRDALLAVLGPTAFNRLALHAMTLGLVDPIGGQWRTDSSGQRLLLVSSGATPVAEIADFNNDRIADIMLVALRGW